MRISIILFFQFVPTTRSMHPGLNLSMQHIPNTEHHSEVPFQPTDNQGDPYHPSTAVGMQPPSLGSGVDVVKRPVQEVFVVDLTKINGSFGISLTVFLFFLFLMCLCVTARFAFCIRFINLGFLFLYLHHIIFMFDELKFSQVTVKTIPASYTRNLRDFSQS